jgi:hypothetical protein
LEDVPGRLALGGKKKTGCKAQDDGKPHEKSNLVSTNVGSLLPPNATESRVFALDIKGLVCQIGHYSEGMPYERKKPRSVAGLFE